MSKNISALSYRKGLEKNLFERMVDAAEQTGTPALADIEQMSEEYLIGDAITLGAVSFYDFLKKENAGKKAYICSGTACLTAGTQEGLEEELEKHLKPEEIGEICCLGRCHENGSFQCQGENYSAKTPEEVAAILEGADVTSTDEYATGSTFDRPLLLAEFPGLNAYYGLLGQMLERPPESLLAELKASKLRGRGGAGFPAGIKWESCRNAKGTPKYIVCNADEGDPGAYIDRYLMEHRPHSVLFGMIVAGYLAGAETGVLYIRAEYPESIRAIGAAIAELYEHNLLGDRILGNDFSFRLKTIKGAGAYICGEETALLASIEGRRPEVGVRPPFPTERGLFGKPTIVNNVETFSCIHSVFSIGGEAFSEIGTKQSTGPKLVSLDGRFNRPGLYEVPMGAPLSEVIDDLGGGFNMAVKAIQVGGPLGGIVPISEIGNLTVDFESFREAGFLLGHGSIVCIPESFPMVRYVEHLFNFTSAESCGKCFPCRLGSVRGGEMFAKAREEGYKMDPELVADLVETMEATSLCALGGGVPLPIKNALHYFKDELEPYFLSERTAR
jgi:NADH-quinone oxidoreductase subunit F